MALNNDAFGINTLRENGILKTDTLDHRANICNRQFQSTFRRESDDEIPSKGQGRIQTSTCRGGTSRRGVKGPPRPLVGPGQRPGRGFRGRSPRRKTIYSVLEWLGRLSLALFCKKNRSFQ